MERILKSSTVTSLRSMSLPIRLCRAHSGDSIRNIVDAFHARELKWLNGTLRNHQRDSKEWSHHCLIGFKSTQPSLSLLLFVLVLLRMMNDEEWRNMKENKKMYTQWHRPNQTLYKRSICPGIRKVWKEYIQGSNPTHKWNRIWASNLC